MARRQKRDDPQKKMLKISLGTLTSIGG